jgi:FkbM family methyltransferase
LAVPGDKTMLNQLKRFIPNDLKQEVKYFLFNILKLKYSRSFVPLEILEWLPKNKPITFFDIGACAGDFSRNISGEYQIKKGILVEPVTKIIPELENNFPDKSRFLIINAAIADKVGEADFYISEDASFVSSLLRIDNKGGELNSLNLADPFLTKIQMLTIDQIAGEQRLQEVDLIKVDVQGAEHLVLLGATDTLKKTKLVYTEFSFKPLYAGSSTFFDLYKIMYANNFILANVSNGYRSDKGELLQGDALYINKAFIK